MNEARFIRSNSFHNEDLQRKYQKLFIVDNPNIKDSSCYAIRSWPTPWGLYYTYYFYEKTNGKLIAIAPYECIRISFSGGFQSFLVSIFFLLFESITSSFKDPRIVFFNTAYPYEDELPCLSTKDNICTIIEDSGKYYYSVYIASGVIKTKEVIDYRNVLFNWKPFEFNSEVRVSPAELNLYERLLHCSNCSSRKPMKIFKLREKALEKSTCKIIRCDRCGHNYYLHTCCGRSIHKSAKTLTLEQVVNSHKFVHIRANMIPQMNEAQETDRSLKLSTILRGLLTLPLHDKKYIMDCVSYLTRCNPNDVISHEISFPHAYPLIDQRKHNWFLLCVDTMRLHVRNNPPLAPPSNEFLNDDDDEEVHEISQVNETESCELHAKSKNFSRGFPILLRGFPQKLSFPIGHIQPQQKKRDVDMFEELSQVREYKSPLGV